MQAKTLYLPGSEGLLTPLMPWLADNFVSEILVNRPGEVFIEKHGLMQCFILPEFTHMHLKRLFAFIANENGQSLNEQNPIFSGNLIDGSRVQLVIPPAAKNYTLSIRRQSIAALSLNDYQEKGFFSTTKGASNIADIQNANDAELLSLYQQANWYEFLSKAIQFKKNIIISGGTSTGKTTFLNACLAEIPKNERLITLEDTFELHAPHANQVNLLAQRSASVSMQDLVQTSLWLRPDRIVMGEIRGREILDFISACATGHEGSMTSIHANNPQITFMRMTQLYKLNNVPSMRDEDILHELNSVVDIIVQLEKTSSGRRLTCCYYKAATNA